MSWNGLSPKTAQEWGAVIPQWLGIVGFIFVFVFWAFTSRLEPALLGAAATLLVGGQGAEALQALKKAPPEPPPVPDTTVQEHQA